MKSDVVVVGAGVLGVTTTHWLNQLFEISVLVVDKETQIGMHTTSRNTGLVHRPYYLNPTKMRIAALTAERSYHMWRKLALRFGLPWSEKGTLMVATEEKQVATLEDYEHWGIKNGMSEDEYELLSKEEVSELEPEVKCQGAILSRRDTSTDYASLTRKVWEMASGDGARFLGDSRVVGVKPADRGLEVELGDGRSVACSLLINAAGGHALNIARMMGLAEEYALLHFRGEYWVVDDAIAPRVSRNIYSVARHAEFPFLDPHFIIRVTGRREVGPNAVLVSGPDAYEGIGGVKELLAELAEKPLAPKAKLFSNRSFLSLLLDESRSSLSKGAMCGRVRRYIPSLRPEMLVERGLAGVRSSLVDENGFVPEAIILGRSNSLHVLNYNSPGATGAPVFSANIVRRLEDEGQLDRFHAKPRKERVWDYDATLSELAFPS